MRPDYRWSAGFARRAGETVQDLGDTWVRGNQSASLAGLRRAIHEGGVP